jgi:hypothetical protein
MLAQFANINPAIGKYTQIAINVTNAGIGSDDAFQTLAWGGCPGGHVFLFPRVCA